MPIEQETGFSMAMLIFVSLLLGTAAVLAFREMRSTGSRRGFKDLRGVVRYLPLLIAAATKGTSLAVHHTLKPAWLALASDLAVSCFLFGSVFAVLWVLATTQVYEKNIKGYLDRIGVVIIVGLLIWWGIAGCVLKGEHAHYIWLDMGIGLLLAPIIIKLTPKPTKELTEKEPPEEEGHFLYLNILTMRRQTPSEDEHT